LTSDLIWREELTKKIVVSMGNYAASGGYYIACNANTILPNTITGSIGVLEYYQIYIATKIGINTEKVETHRMPLTIVVRLFP
jgi:protease-4